MTPNSGGGDRVQLPVVRLGPFSYPKPFRIISGDPGGTTGLAICTYDPDFLEDQLSFTGMQLGPGKHHFELYKELLGMSNFDDSAIDVVCESFEFRQPKAGEDGKRKVELISREYIGVFELFTQYLGLRLHMQTASTAKAFIPDKPNHPEQNVKLKKLGLWVPGDNGKHAMDAYRHLLRYMVVSDRQLKNFLAERWFRDE